ncbi:class I SAM-dependent methyltransferase [Pseudomonas stutzeri]|uniref:Class I SAM-dependent methyltransferase n=1 Tax=Stutzerimonas stutzeri TaxID=316 RepID=A0A2N8S5E4_STUST|nr:class I SAM-dependent methyltransferase [Stutzerimonas stutzeri]MCQ4296678.1 class I SAM-dependent methyltransferase [Stutzerimonas stutzeri]PNF81842.1 class I SAM-dependent methyltransferase [Stutzerimonas stutzeri]
MPASESRSPGAASESVQLFSSRSTDYARFRPTYPEALFSWLASQCAETEIAMDVAAGNGQASFPLTRHFHQVLACDASAEQLNAADDWPDVQRVVADAHQLPVQNGQLDLLVVAQALHWFATPAFFAQARLALKPHGLFCAWCYSLLEVAPPVDALIQNLHSEILAGYWPAGRTSVDAGYQDIRPPFARIACPAFSLAAHWDLAELIGYLRTWSAVKQWQKQHRRDPVAMIEPQLSSAWGPPDQRRRVRWPLHFMTGFPNR